MDKKETGAKKSVGKKPTASKLPKEVAETLRVNPEKVCYMSNDGKAWFWSKTTATKHFGEGNFKEVRA